MNKITDWMPPISLKTLKMSYAVRWISFCNTSMVNYSRYNILSELNDDGNISESSKYSKVYVYHENPKLNNVRVSKSYVYLKKESMNTAVPFLRPYADL